MFCLFSDVANLCVKICIIMYYVSATFHFCRSMHRYDGLIFSVGGNGRSYVVILETGPLADTSQSKKYFARMTTKIGFCRVSTR